MEKNEIKLFYEQFKIYKNRQLVSIGLDFLLEIIYIIKDDLNKNLNCSLKILKELEVK